MPLNSVLLALNGAETEKVLDALRVLDIILRQTSAERGCLLRQPFTDVTRHHINIMYSSGNPSNIANPIKDASVKIDLHALGGRLNLFETTLCKPGKSTYLPLELCSLVSLQRYTKALSSEQRASLVEKSMHKPLERKKVLTDSMDKYGYDKVPLLSACGISIEKQLTKFDGHVLDTPKLKVGGDEDCIPHNGRWNFNKKKLMKTITIKHWLVVNFSADHCDISRLSRDLINCGKSKGIVVECPYTIIEEEHEYRGGSPHVRVKDCSCCLERSKDCTFQATIDGFDVGECRGQI